MFLFRWFWFSRCYCVLPFLGYSKNSEQEAQRRARVRVSLNALTAVQVPETRILDSSWMQHADASTCCTSWRVRTTWPWEGAPCIVLHSIQTLHAECQMESVRFSTFEDRSFGGLSDVLKKRLGAGLLGNLTTCTFRRLVHVSLGQRMVFVQLIQRYGAAPIILVEPPWATSRCSSLRDLYLCNSC